MNGFSQQKSKIQYLKKATKFDLFLETSRDLVSSRAVTISNTVRLRNYYVEFSFAILFLIRVKLCFLTASSVCLL